MSQHTDHAVVRTPAGWCCEACPFRCSEIREAHAHAVAHQYAVAPPKPPPERSVRW